MFSVVKWEIKKSFKPGVFVLWALGLFLGYISLYVGNGVNDAYADLFSKYYGIAPIMGLAMFFYVCRKLCTRIQFRYGFSYKSE